MSGRTIAVGLLMAAVSGGAETLHAQNAVEVYHACYAPRSGTVYRIKTADTRPACVARSHVEFSWNAEGPQGLPGPAGPEGPQGPPGEAAEFSGVFTSPNGRYSLMVTDDGIELRGARSDILLNESGVHVRSTEGVSLVSSGAQGIKLDAANRLQLDAGDLRAAIDNDIQMLAARNMNLTSGSGMSAASGSDMTLASGKNVLFTSANSLHVNVGGGLQFDAAGNVSLKGANIDIKNAFGSNLRLSGPDGELIGTNLKLQSSVTLAATAGLITLNGSCRAMSGIGHLVSVALTSGQISEGSTSVFAC